MLFQRAVLALKNVSWGLEPAGTKLICVPVAGAVTSSMLVFHLVLAACVTDRAVTDPSAEMMLLHLHSLESSSLPMQCSLLLERNLWIYAYKTKSF